MLRTRPNSGIKAKSCSARAFSDQTTSKALNPASAIADTQNSVSPELDIIHKTHELVITAPHAKNTGNIGRSPALNFIAHSTNIMPLWSGIIDLAGITIAISAIATQYS